MSVVLAVDGGNSKTDLALVSDDGEVLGVARGPLSSPHHLGLDGCVAVLEQLLAEAGGDVAGRSADVGVLLLAGIDFPDEESRLQEAVEARGWVGRTIVGNDTFAVLRAGTERGWGVAVVCGAGINCLGVAPDGRHVRFPALGEISGDWGGGHDVGMAALGAAARGEDGRGPRTSLERLVPAHFGLDAPHELVRAIHVGRFSEREVIELAPIVLAAAADDAVAAEIVDRLAAEVVALARAALDAARPDRRARARRARRRAAAVRRRAPAARHRDAACASSGRSSLIDAAVSPPIVGSALLGLDELGAGPEAQARLRRELGEAVERSRDARGGELVADVQYDQATRIYPGTEIPAVNGLDLQIADGEFMVLVGPSGSGKTTALRMLAGLEEVDAGEIRIGDRDVTDLAPKDRDIAMVFQNYALYPYLTVADNIGFPLRIAKVPKAERQKRVARGRRAARPDRVPPPQAVAALGRAAPARRDGPGDHPAAERLPDGRAALEPRREAARPDARRHRDDAGGSRRDDRVRHARPVRGDDARPPGRRAEGRLPAAVRHAARDVRPAGEHVRRGLHRLAGDEPLPGAGPRTEPRRSAPSRCRCRAGRTGTPRSCSGCGPRRSSSRPTGCRPRSRSSRSSAPTPSPSASRTWAGRETKLVARVDARRAPSRGDRVSLRPNPAEAHCFDPDTGARLSD